MTSSDINKQTRRKTSKLPTANRIDLLFTPKMTPTDIVDIKTNSASATAGANRNLNFLWQWIQPGDFA
ncbi:MAG: hypothetical protein WBO06_14010, partial [Gammaproteobacteria bacterium]